MTTKLKITMSVLFIVFALCFSGCSQQNATDADYSCGEISILQNIDERFVGFEQVHYMHEWGYAGAYGVQNPVASGVHVFYLREKLTDVMYVWRTTGERASGGGYSFWSSGFTAMMDPVTGGPLTYTNWLKYLKDKNTCPKCGETFAEVIPAYCPKCGAAITSADTSESEGNNGER